MRVALFNPRKGCRQRSVLSRHRSDKAVAAPRDIGDVTPPVLSVAERTTQRRNVNSEACFFDEGIWPDASEELLLAQQLTRLLHERDQNVASAATEANGVVVLEELLSADKQTKRAKGDNFVRCFAGLV